MSRPIEPGSSSPLGAHPRAQGVNFSVRSEAAERLELLLFGDQGDSVEVLELDPRTNRSAGFWHAFVPGLMPGQHYGFRAHGPDDPEEGLHFDGSKVLLDPNGRGVCAQRYDRTAAALPGANTGRSLESVVVDLAAYDWEDDAPPRTPVSRTVVYEMHVRGFTAHPSSGVPAPRAGTYAGVVDKIPYLQQLGITAVELLPVFQFDTQQAPPGRTNYWGYSPISYFSPHTGYATRPDAQVASDEFRDMVKALHRAGIEVILDVVYNHTAEGDDNGPWLSWRGLAGDQYYLVDPTTGRQLDFTGTGNTLNTNGPLARRMVLESLRFWVQEMHVDGFRFDLASIFCRGEDGEPVSEPPVLGSIASDPVLAGTKLIAEAWDAAGLYRVGQFSGPRWLEWNDRFRDDVRAFVRGDGGRTQALARRLEGSPDIFGSPNHSVNFVTCHDGFTLGDLVSYNSKHNEANAEESRDGSDHNLSWNCGVEGPTDDPDIESLRQRQVKNLAALNVLSRGIPMLTMGDEVLRTQQGNNNPYCHDSELTWFDWAQLETHAETLRFIRALLELRRGLDLRTAEFSWHGCRLNEPDWSDEARGLALTVTQGRWRVHGMILSGDEALDFELPAAPPGARVWRRLIDTSMGPPDDIATYRRSQAVRNSHYSVGPRSLVMLVARGLSE